MSLMYTALVMASVARWSGRDCSRCRLRGSRFTLKGYPTTSSRASFLSTVIERRRKHCGTDLKSHSNADRVEIWCGDCAEAIKQIKLPQWDALTFAFIDPTGIAHAPFALIKRLHQAVRCDLLINIQHGMGIKMNLHQYTPDATEGSALTKFLGSAEWKTLLPATNAGEFFRSLLDLYKENLRQLGFKFIGREVLVSTTSNKC